MRIADLRLTFTAVVSAGVILTCSSCVRHFITAPSLSLTPPRSMTTSGWVYSTRIGWHRRTPDERLSKRRVSRPRPESQPAQIPFSAPVSRIIKEAITKRHDLSLWRQGIQEADELRPFIGTRKSTVDR